MRRLARAAATGIVSFLTLGAGGPAQACADGGCYAAWKLASRDLSCEGQAALQPGNDTRINLLMLLSDRAGQGPRSLPSPANYNAGEGATFFSWPMLRDGFYPPADEDDGGSVDGSRCDGIKAGAAAFNAALVAEGVAPWERAQLAAARGRLTAVCEGRGDRRTFYGREAEPAPALPDWPAVTSGKAKPFLAYLQAAEAFYAGEWDGARRGFAGLVGGSGWVADTAAYMAARVELNAAVAPALSDYGSFDRGKIDLAAVTRGGRALEAYFKARPQGRYAASARGLVRRTQWLAGDFAGLARELAAQLAVARIEDEATARLVEEIDAKFLVMTNRSEGVDDPLLLATLDLKAMRENDWGYGGDELPRLTAAALAAQQPKFAGHPELYSLLQANHAYYVARDMKRVLQLVPDDARRPAYGAVAFSRQYLRGMALAALKDRNEAGFWLELLGGAKAAWQRPLVELGLAINYERNAKLGQVFAKDSPIRDETIRRILLTQSAGPALLRQQAGNAAAPRTEREVALHTLFEKQLTRGMFGSFVGDTALLRALGPARPRAADDYSPLWLEPYRAPRLSDGYPCPALVETARGLAADPRAIKPRLCLGDFFRLNGLDRIGEYEPERQPDELGAGANGFPQPLLARGVFYAEIIADPRTPAPDRAYALYRAVMCYAPSGSNDCGGKGFPESQRRAWFQQLKRDYPRSPWAQKLKAYW